MHAGDAVHVEPPQRVGAHAAVGQVDVPQRVASRVEALFDAAADVLGCRLYELLQQVLGGSR